MLTLSEEQQGGHCGWRGCSAGEVPDGDQLHLDEKTLSFTVPGLKDGFLEEVSFKLFYDH